jgi:hypothetical protein
MMIIEIGHEVKTLMVMLQLLFDENQIGQVLIEVLLFDEEIAQFDLVILQ